MVEFMYLVFTRMLMSVTSVCVTSFDHKLTPNPMCVDSVQKQLTYNLPVLFVLCYFSSVINGIQFTKIINNNVCVCVCVFGDLQ